MKRPEASYTPEAANLRFEAIPNPGLEERIIRAIFYFTKHRLEKRYKTLGQRRYDSAPPCPCGDAYCERNTFWGFDDPPH